MYTDIWCDPSDRIATRLAESVESARVNLLERAAKMLAETVKAARNAAIDER